MVRGPQFGESDGRRKKAFELCPFTVVIDTREQLPWGFRNFKCDSPKQDLPLIVNTIRKTLKTGDYSIEGMESGITIERKSLSDLYSTISQGRERFIAEFERMCEFEFAALVIEADWSMICSKPPKESKLHPKSVFRALIAWSQRYKVHVHAMANPVFAEEMAFRLLQRYWLDRQVEGWAANREKK